MGLKPRLKAFMAKCWRWILKIKSMRLTTWKDLATISALILGGIWTYMLWIQNRQNRPRLMIAHLVERYRIPRRHQVLLGVTEKFSNVGPVAIELKKGEIRVYQVLPLPDGADQRAKTADSLNDTTEDDKVWPVLQVYLHPWDKERELIEPGEGDEIKNYFLIPDSIEVVNIISYAGNPAEGSKMAWQASTGYDLRSECGTALTEPKEAPVQRK